MTSLVGGVGDSVERMAAYSAYIGQLFFLFSGGGGKTYCDFSLLQSPF